MFYLMKSKYAIFSHFKVTKIERSAFLGDTRYSRVNFYSTMPGNINLLMYVKYFTVYEGLHLMFFCVKFHYTIEEESKQMFNNLD